MRPVRAASVGGLSTRACKARPTARSALAGVPERCDQVADILDAHRDLPSRPRRSRTPCLRSILQDRTSLCRNAQECGTSCRLARWWSLPISTRTTCATSSPPPARNSFRRGAGARRQAFDDRAAHLRARTFAGGAALRQAAGGLVLTPLGASVLARIEQVEQLLSPALRAIAGRWPCHDIMSASPARRRFATFLADALTRFHRPTCRRSSSSPVSGSRPVWLEHGVKRELASQGRADRPIRICWSEMS